MARARYYYSRRKVQEDDGYFGVVLICVGIYIYFQLGWWMKEQIWPEASRTDALLLCLSSPGCLWFVLKTAYIRRKYKQWPSKLFLRGWGGVFGALLTVGMLLDYEDARLARQGRTWHTHQINNTQLKLETSWDRGVVNCKLSAICPHGLDSECLGGSNLLIDFLDGESRTLHTVPMWNSVQSTYPMNRGAYLDSTSWKYLFYPYGAGAQCRDGWISYSTGSGTCSHHGGVNRWLSRF